MKTKFRSFHLLMAAAALSLTFAVSALAETPREELAHAYRLLKTADADYNGHRVVAMEELQKAGKVLNLRLEGDAPERERQFQSDKKLTEARRLLGEAREKLEAKDKDRIVERINQAIREIDLALKIK